MNIQYLNTDANPTSMQFYCNITIFQLRNKFPNTLIINKNRSLTLRIRPHSLTPHYFPLNGYKYSFSLSRQKKLFTPHPKRGTKSSSYSSLCFHESQPKLPAALPHEGQPQIALRGILQKIKLYRNYQLPRRYNTPAISYRRMAHRRPLRIFTSCHFPLAFSRPRNQPTNQSSPIPPSFSFPFVAPPRALWRKKNSNQNRNHETFRYGICMKLGNSEGVVSAIL